MKTVTNNLRLDQRIWNTDEPIKTALHMGLI